MACVSFARAWPANFDQLDLTPRPVRGRLQTSSAVQTTFPRRIRRSRGIVPGRQARCKGGRDHAVPLKAADSPSRLRSVTRPHTRFRMGSAAGRGLALEPPWSMDPWCGARSTLFCEMYGYTNDNAAAKRLAPSFPSKGQNRTVPFEKHWRMLVGVADPILTTWRCTGELRSSKTAEINSKRMRSRSKKLGQDAAAKYSTTGKPLWPHICGCRQGDPLRI